MSAVEERIRMLRARFAETLPDRLAELRRTWMRLCANPASAEVREQLARQLHTLGGTAGSYGLTNVAGLGVEGELTCAEAVEGLDAETLRYLATIVDDIGRAVHRWMKGDPE